jgi:hypothetical protein
VNGIPYSVPRSSLPQEDSVEQLFGKAWDSIMLNNANVKSSLDQAAQQANNLKGQ